MALADEIEAGIRLTGLRVPVSFDGAVVGVEGDRQNQPRQTDSVFMEIIEQDSKSDSSGAIKSTIKTSMSSVNAYIPEVGHRMTLFGKEYRMTLVQTDSFGEEINGYIITGEL